MSLKDSFTFAADFRTQNYKYILISCHVDSRFTNIPLDDTIDICVCKSFGRKRKVNGFSQ